MLAGLPALRYPALLTMIVPLFDGNWSPRHRPTAHLIVTDGVFSMEGDICLLPQLIELKKEFGCYLMIDEAHALGVLGLGGRGTHEHFGIAAKDVDIWSGSLAEGDSLQWRIRRGVTRTGDLYAAFCSAIYFLGCALSIRSRRNPGVASNSKERARACSGTKAKR